MEHRFTLEKSVGVFTLDSKNRNRVKKCPFCGKSNYDGKFVPYVGHTRFGVCYSCGRDEKPSEHRCPKCGQQSFRLYVDNENAGLPLNDDCGFCSQCRYNYPPRDFFRDNGGFDNFMKHEYAGLIRKDVWMNQATTTTPTPEPEPPTPVPERFYLGSLRNYHQNNFVKWLHTLFPVSTVEHLVDSYKIGTSKHHPGSVVFWQIDGNGVVHAGKIMVYNPATGKRSRERKHHVDWVHNVTGMKGTRMEQSLFGLHLVKDNPTKTIGIVESEKTAIVCSVYLPELVWLACGSLTGLSIRKLTPLAGKSIVLFPDSNGFDAWGETARRLGVEMPGTRFVVSDILEKHVSDDDKMAGFDLADYLVKFPVEQFTGTPSTGTTQRATTPQVNPEPDGGIPDFVTVADALRYLGQNKHRFPEICRISANGNNWNRNVIFTTNSNE